MLNATFPEVRQVLCLGAHADDIEIGCGGTVLKLVSRYPEADFHWIVFSAPGTRKQEARVQRGSIPPRRRLQDDRGSIVSRRLLPLSGERDQRLF